MLVARRENLLRTVAERIRQAYRVEVRPVAADLAAPDLTARIANATQDLEIGTLVYNAAHVPVGRFVDTDPASLARAIDVNVKGPVILTRSLLPAMCRRNAAPLY